MSTHPCHPGPHAAAAARRSPRRCVGKLPQSGQRLARLALVFMVAALASACGGGDDAAPSANEPPGPVLGTVAVSASLGAVVNAEVSVTCALTGTVLGTANTGSTGAVNVSTSGACAGPLLVSVNARADGTSTYFDEATASALAFPAGSSVRAVAPSFSTAMSVAVTALTEIAARQALANAGSLAALNAAQVAAANAAVVAQVLGAGVTLDVLSLPTMWNAATTLGSLGTGTADRHAFYLASLARAGQGNAAPALAVLAALAADLADGTLSGSASGFVYTAGSLAAQLTAARNAMAAYASPALQSALGVTPPAALALTGFSPTSGEAAATITLTGTGFDPDPFHMLVKFSNNLTAEVVSSSATSLVVKVPAGAVSGPIVVTHTITGQSVTSGTGFTVTTAGGGGGGGGGGGAGTWLSRASPSTALLNGLAYGGGRFVAVGFIRALLTSADGLSWTAATAPDTGYYSANAVVWSGSQFVMVGDQDFGSPLPPLIATSPDGSAWTRRNWTHGFETALVDVAVGGGKLTVVGANGRVASSSDAGLTWSTEATSGVAAFTGVAGNTGTRVAVGRDAGFNGVILVDTGSGWQATSGVADFYPADVTWTGEQFVAVGGSFAGIGANAVVMTSPNGINWARRALSITEAPAGFSLRAVLALGSTLYATGDNQQTQHVIVKSSDAGATWSIAYQGQTNGNAMLAGIAASAERVVTVGGVKSVTLP